MKLMVQRNPGNAFGHFRLISTLAGGILLSAALVACSGSDPREVSSSDGASPSETLIVSASPSDEYQPIWGAELSTVGGDVELERFNGSGDKRFEVNELDGMDRVNVYLFCDSGSSLSVFDADSEAVVTSDCPAVPERVQIFGAEMRKFQIRTDPSNKWTVMLAKPNIEN